MPYSKAFQASTSNITRKWLINLLVLTLHVLAHAPSPLTGQPEVPSLGCAPHISQGRRRSCAASFDERHLVPELDQVSVIAVTEMSGARAQVYYYSYLYISVSSRRR